MRETRREEKPVAMGSLGRCGWVVWRLLPRAHFSLPVILASYGRTLAKSSAHGKMIACSCFSLEYTVHCCSPAKDKVMLTMPCRGRSRL